MAHIYSVSSSCHCTSSASLIDHGANDGIAGDDVHVIKKMMHTVNVQGIDNDEGTGIPIITIEAVVMTQCGPVIAIMPQYAYLGHGKSIHSSAQP